MKSKEKELRKWREERKTTVAIDGGVRAESKVIGEKMTTCLTD